MKTTKVKRVLALGLILLLVLHYTTPFVGQPQYSAQAEDTVDSTQISGSQLGDSYLSGTTMYVNDSSGISLTITSSKAISGVKLYKGGYSENLSLVSTGVYQTYNLVGLTGDSSVEITFDDATIETYVLKDIISGFTDISNVEKDTTAPVLGDITTSDEVNGTPIVLSADGDSIEIPVTESTTISSCSVDMDDSSNGSCSIEYNNGLFLDISSLTDTVHTVTVSVTDYFGESSSKSYTFVKNHSFPEVSLSADTSNVVNKGSSTYIDGNGLDITVSGNNNPAISDTYLVLTDGTNTSNISFNSSNIAHINESGNYSLYVEDYNGVSNTYELSSKITGIYSNIVSDETSPSMTVLANGVNYSTLSGTWLTESADLSISISDSSEVSYYSLSINDVSVAGETVASSNITKTYNILDFINSNGESVGGLYKIKVDTKDLLGNPNSEEFTLQIDVSNPMITTISTSGEPNVVNNVSYINNSVVIGESYEISDTSSGVKSIEVYKDGVYVGDFPYTIDSDGDYTIKVTDNANRTTDISVNSLWGNNSSNTIKVDSDNPTISRVSGFDSGVLLEEEYWYSAKGTLVYSISDSNISSIKATINGSNVPLTNNGNLYSLDMPDTQGMVKVVISVTDIVNTEVTDTFIYYLDTTNPSISNIDIGTTEYNNINNTLYFKGTPNIKINASDSESGVKEYIMYKNGVVDSSNTTGEFVLSTGEYSFEVKDNLGNSSGVKSLGNLLNENTSNVIVDVSPPEVNYSRPEGDVNSWFPNDVVYTGTVSDTDGIQSVSISINNTIVQEYSRQGDTLLNKIELSGGTSGVSADTNGMYSVLVTAKDSAGNVATWSDVIYIDKSAPEITEVSFSGDGYLEGKYKDSNGDYGFYFKGDATCNVKLSDGTASSGIKNVHVILKSYSGEVTEQDIDGSTGSISFTIPTNFKGHITLSVSDNVGNGSGDINPDGIITENASSIGISINLPETSYKDINGLPLYNSDFSAEAVIDSPFSGVRKIEWGIGNETKGTVNIDNNGNISGDISSITGKEKNIIVSLDKVLSVSENDNNISIWVKVTDRAGYSSVVSKNISIDKSSPNISVTYDTSVMSNSYYNYNKTASITVEDSNFNPDSFVISGSSGTLGAWSRNGNVWTNSISFSVDGDYSYTLSCYDYAMNASNVYTSPIFTIDKSSPSISVSWNNNESSNGNYYSSSRVATITVTEHNFNLSNITISGGSVGNWSSNGDTHTVSVTFSTDGEHELLVSGKDNAGNPVNNYSSGSFIIDQTIPVIKIAGVEDGVSYKKDSSVSINLSDNDLDTYKTSITMTGKRRGDIELSGTITANGGVLSIDEFPYEEAYDDVYTISVKAYDKAGNYSEELLTFSINRNGSSYEFMTSDILGNYLNTVNSISLKEYNVDKINTSKSKVVIYLNGDEIEIPQGTVKISNLDSEDGKYVYQYTIDKSVFKEDGKYLIQIYSTSDDGTEYSSITEEYAFVLDRVNPEVIISGVESNGKYKAYSKKVTIDIRDITGVKEIVVLLDGEELKVSKEDTIYSVEIPENSSKQSLQVIVTDYAGNVTTVDVENVLVTADTWLYLTNQGWFKVLIALILTSIILGASILIITRNRKKREIEKQLSADLEEIYSSNSSSGDQSE